MYVRVPPAGYLEADWYVVLVGMRSKHRGQEIVRDVGFDRWDRTNPLRQKPSRSLLHVRTTRDVPEIKKYQLEGRLAVPVQLQICAIHTR